MRCSCHVCDTYMAQSEGIELGCVCPECGYRCKACLGTNTVVSREALKGLVYNQTIMRDIFEEPEKSSYVPKAEEKDPYLD